VRCWCKTPGNRPSWEYSDLACLLTDNTDKPINSFSDLEKLLNYVAFLIAKTSQSIRPLLHLKLMAATCSHLIFPVTVAHTVAAGSA
jgi:hypothetical protein